MRTVRRRNAPCVQQSTVPHNKRFRLTSAIRCVGASWKATLHGKKLDCVVVPLPSCPLYAHQEADAVCVGAIFS